MAAYKHGVYTSETPTSLIPTTEVLSAVPFVVGIAPINMAQEPSVNEPKLVYSYKEAVQYFGVENATDDGNGKKSFKYNLSEFIYSTFNFYGNTPIVLVNVLDPAKHKKTADTTAITIDAKGQAVVQEFGCVVSTLKISKPDTGFYAEGTDYVTAFDDDGYLVISALPEGSDGNFKLAKQELTITVEKLDPSAVTKKEIIGGVTPEGKKTGLELISEVYPRLRIIPTLVASPHYSADPEVAAIMGAKALNINTVFNAMAIVDADTKTTKKYSDVPNWKNKNNIVDPNVAVTWPQIEMTGTRYASSTHLIGVLARTDGERDGVPYVSPSNKNFEGTGLCLEDGSEVVLGNEEANYLNGEGIVAALNFSGGWKIWGNRTSCYPANTDPKDAFIPVKRMFFFIANTVVTTMWQKVDEPGNRRLIDTIVDSLNVWLNAFTARQQLLGGRIEFRKEDNPVTDLMDGKYHFKIFITPPSPARELSFDLEIDPTYYETLFN